MFFAALVVDGILAGAIYALLALAFVVVYKATRMVNFALGEWAMVGSRLVATGVNVADVGLLGAIALGSAGMVALAAAFARLVLRRLTGRALIALIMVTLGLGALLRGAVAFVFPAVPDRIPFPVPLDPLGFPGIPVSGGRLAAALVAAACIAATSWFFRATRTGIALRAVADNQQVAMTVGIDLDRYIAIAWALAAVISLLAGTLWTIVSGGGVGVVIVGLKIFPIVILGGLDSIAGTIVGAVVIGILESLSAGYLDAALGGGFSNVASYLVLLVALSLRPHGLFGRPVVERI